MTIVATTKADRIALIASLAEKHNRKIMRGKSKPSVAAFAKEYNNKPQPKSDNDNINHYTDPRQYANEHYGQNMYHTTKHDTDWGDF